MFNGRHFDRSVILLCVRWYLAYSLSLRNLEEMMAEHGISVDHVTVHLWTIYYAPLLLEQFNLRKRAVTRRWHIDETYIKVRGRWTYLYRAIDSHGDTIEFWFGERRNLATTRMYLTSRFRPQTDLLSLAAVLRSSASGHSMSDPAWIGHNMAQGEARWGCLDGNSAQDAQSSRRVDRQGWLCYS
jgi:hypothetical protein